MKLYIKVNLVYFKDNIEKNTLKYKLTTKDPFYDKDLKSIINYYLRDYYSDYFLRLTDIPVIGDL